MSTAAPQYVANPLVYYGDFWIGGIDPFDHVARLEAKGVFIDLTARGVQCHRSNRPGPKRLIRLGSCKVGDLGFTKPPTTTELIAVVKRFGSLCPSEMGAHAQEMLVLHPGEECFTVLMEPIPDREGVHRMFTVRKTARGVCRLGARYAQPGHRWLLDCKVVAVISR